MAVFLRFSDRRLREEKCPASGVGGSWFKFNRPDHLNSNGFNGVHCFGQACLPFYRSEDENVVVRYSGLSKTNFARIDRALEAQSEYYQQVV